MYNKLDNNNCNMSECVISIKKYDNLGDYIQNKYV